MSTLGRLSLAFIASFLGFSLPALAGDFEDGCTLYSIKHYKNAELSFKKALDANPSHAPTHYYLGMIYLNGGKTAQAKKEFQTCLNLRPDATTTQYCQSILARLNGANASRPVAAPAAAQSSRPAAAVTYSGSPSHGSPAASSAPLGDAGHAAEVEKRRKQILDKAERDVAEVRADYEARLSQGTNYKDATHMYVKEDGTTIYDMSPEVRAAIKQECEAKVEKIREMADYQLKFVK